MFPRYVYIEVVKMQLPIKKKSAFAILKLHYASCTRKSKPITLVCQGFC